MILSIHIDSSEINLAAGYVENETVNLLALKRGILQGINFGNITNKDLFTHSVVENIQDFLDNHLKIENREKAKDLNLDIADDKLVVKRISYNIIVSELRKQSPIQTHILKEILKNYFFADDVILGDEVIFKCTADTAATTLLVDENQVNKPYLININLCYNSTWINFIKDQNDYFIESLSVEKGFKEIVNSINNNPKIKRPLPLEAVYNGLSGFNFLVTRSKHNFRIPLFNVNFTISDTEESIVLPLQEVFHLCYDKLKELDRDGLRFTPNFFNKVQLNIMGYGADLQDVSAVASLVFSERLENEIEYFNKQKEEKLTSNGQQLEQTSLNLVTGMQYYSHSFLPSANLKSRTLIYYTSEEQLKIEHKVLKVSNKVYFRPGICFSFSHFMVDNAGRECYKLYQATRDQFTTSFGLIYNFHLARPKPIKVGFFESLLKFFKM
ncbi:hypothetical protein [Psittacicella hinzii]|uniref:hypothetical protein n=1 Tax=Psittacicella hinzii TaxID=2028575 RepID=UPI001CA648EC|nr:hypothetical protein [Psittacicella hinzii]